MVNPMRLYAVAEVKDQAEAVQQLLQTRGVVTRTDRD